MSLAEDRTEVEGLENEVVRRRLEDNGKTDEVRGR